jgi:transposase
MFDIIEISKLLGVSDKTVYRYFKKYNSQINAHILKNEQGNKALTREGVQKLARLTNKEIDLPGETKDDLLMKELREQIQELKADKKYLQEQNKELKTNISNLTKLLDQEQQLRLHSIKQLEEPKENSSSDTEESNDKTFFQKIIDKMK